MERFTFETLMAPHTNGAYVKFTDHIAATQAEHAELLRVKTALVNLLACMTNESGRYSIRAEHTDRVREAQQVCGCTPPQGPEITRTLVLSTSHLSQEACNRYEGVGFRSRLECGVLFYVPPEEDVDRESLEGAIPSALVDAFKMAKKLDCTHVEFDADGPVMDGLETFNW